MSHPPMKERKYFDVLADYLRARLLRQASKGGKRKPCLSVRLSVATRGDEYKARVVEFGLGTSDEDMAAYGAALLVRGLRAAGVRVASKLPE